MYAKSASVPFKVALTPSVSLHFILAPNEGFSPLEKVLAGVVLLGGVTFVIVLIALIVLCNNRISGGDRQSRTMLSLCPESSQNHVLQVQLSEGGSSTDERADASENNQYDYIDYDHFYGKNTVNVSV